MSSYPMSHLEKQGWGKRGTERLLQAKGDLLELLSHVALYFPGYLWTAGCSWQGHARLPFQGPGLPRQAGALSAGLKCGEGFLTMAEGSMLTSIISAFLVGL